MGDRLVSTRVWSRGSPGAWRAIAPTRAGLAAPTSAPSGRVCHVVAPGCVVLCVQASGNPSCARRGLAPARYAPRRPCGRCSGLLRGVAPTTGAALVWLRASPDRHACRRPDGSQLRALVEQGRVDAHVLEPLVPDQGF